MSRWAALAGDVELRRYLLWRLRRNPLAIVTVPMEWAKALAERRALKAARPRDSSERLSGASGPNVARMWPSPDRVAAVVQAARSRAAQASSAIVSEGERIVGGSVRLRTGARCEWEGERCDAPDPEHRDSFNRQYHALTLAWAWALTHDDRFAKAFTEVFRRWAAAHPASADDPAWGPYTVSERIVAWGQSVPLLWDAPGFRDDSLPALVQHLETEARWLADRLETAGRHNHLINNGRALFLYGAWFGDARGESVGWRILTEELRRQVGPDGVLAEQSIPYHLLLTRTYVEALATRLTAVAVERDISDGMLRMVAAARALLRPDGSVPLVGDTSPDASPEVLGRFVLDAAARLNGVGNLSAAVALDLIDGLSGIAPCPRGDEGQAGGRSTWLGDSGYAIRSTARQHLVMHADPRGLVLRHGHADALSLTLWADGMDLLIDPGNASYVPDEWLAYFRGPRAHNAPVIDDLPVTPYDWVYQQLCSDEYRDAQVRCSPPREVNGWWTVIGSHHGYARAFGRGTVERRIVASDDYVWITDRVEVPGRHRCRIGWAWGPLRLQSEATSVSVLVAETIGLCVTVQFLADTVPMTAAWISGRQTPIDGWRSPAYGSRTEALTAICEREFDNAVRMDACISLRADAPVRIARADEDGAEARVESAAWIDTLVFDTSNRSLVSARRQPSVSS